MTVHRAKPNLIGITCLTSAVLASVSACTTPVYTKRYMELVISPEASPPLTVSAFVTKAEGASKSTKLVADISGRGQAAAIEALSKEKSLTASEVQAFLSQKVTPAKTAKSIWDYTVFKKRIGVVVDYESSNSELDADRLASLRTKFSLVDEQSDTHPSTPIFDSWSKLTSKDIVVDLGDLTFKQTAESSINTIAAEGVTLDSKFSNELTEVMRLRETIVPLYGVLNKDVATIVQKGSLGRDLVGIQTVDLTVKLEAKQTKLAVTSFKPPEKKEKAKISINSVTYAKYCNPVMLQVDASGKLRKVVKGQKTIVESDDSVDFQNVLGDNKNSLLPLLTAQEINVSYWSIVGGSGPLSGNRIVFSNAAGSDELRFLSYSNAQKFLAWAKSQRVFPASIGDTKLQLYNVRQGGYLPNARQWSSYRSNANIAAASYNGGNASGDCPKPHTPIDTSSSSAE